MDKRNLGVFRIGADLIEKNPKEVHEIFSLLKIVPIKVEYRPDWNAFEYLAIGERFEKIPECCAAPGYELKITKSDAGNIELIEVGKI